MIRRRCALAVWTSLLLASGLVACRERTLGPEPGVNVAAAFEVAADWVGLFDPTEVDRVRAAVLHAETGEALGSAEAAWDPVGGAWSVAIDATPAPAGPVDFVVQVELLADGAEPAWSGRSDAITSMRTGAPTPVAVTLFRGPLANLAARSVEVLGGPATMDEGDSVALSAEITFEGPASGPDARVFWTSVTPFVATVDDRGVVTASSPGMASILAVVGPAADSALIQVDVVPTGVLLDPPHARLTSLTERVTVEGAVVDARGDTLTGYTLLWASTDTSVLEPLGAGAFEAAASGDAEVVASVDGTPSVEGRVPVEVSQEVATASLSADTVRFGALGETQVLALVAEDAAGVVVGSLQVDWGSTDASVATVDPSGHVTAVGNGRAEITVRVSAGSGVPLPGPSAAAPAALPGTDTVTAATVVEVEQVVSSVAVTPADTVVLGPGTALAFSASAADANGHAVAEAAFAWSSSDGSVASIDGDGVARTAGAGVTSIEAEAGGVTGSAELTVLTTGGVSRVWIGGAEDGPSDWSNADNWLPRLVPVVVDTALIQATAADQPRLSSDRSVAGLRVEDGATVDLDGFQLTVGEDLEAGGTLVGPGVVRMIGDGASVRGSLPNLVVHGTIAVSGPVAVTGDLTVEGPGRGLDIGPHPATVTGVLHVRDGATLAMTDPAASVDVDGQVVFDGASTLGLLTAGELRVGGNLTAWTSDPLNYAPTGSHRTVLDGAVIQTVYLHHNAPDHARFNELEIDNPGGVVLQSTARITGDVTLLSGTLGGDQTAVIGGDLVEAGGGNQYRVLNTTFTGSPSLPASVQTNATFPGAYAFADDVSIVGDLLADGAAASLDIGPHSVAVSGQLRLVNGAVLVLQDDAGALDVDGDVFFDGASTLGLLTAGELRVGGALTAWTSDPENFAPTGSHRTVLDGSSSQSVYVQHSGVGESGLRHFEVDNAAGVTLLSTTRVAGDLVLTEGTLEGTQTVFLGGGLTEVVGGHQYRVLNTIVSGPAALPSSLRTNLTIAGAYAATRDMEVVGNVFVDGSGATLDVGSNTVSVTGDFRTADGGTLTMQDPPGVLDVGGEAEFNGGSTQGLLTAGELRLAGNFTAWTSHAENFAPTGAHSTNLDGTVPQTVYLYHSGADQGRFEDVEVTNAAGVTFLGTTRVTDELTVSTALSVGLGQTVLVAGHFTLEASAILTNDGSLQANGCSLDGTVVGNAPICP